MMINKKETAWKKNRRFSEVHGGRRFPKITDGIFNRAHSLQRPSTKDELPILIQENPSRNYFFPVTVTECLEALESLPQKHTKGITHLWLRRFKTSEYEKGDLPLSEFICGSGVRVIVIYPWPKNRVQNFGKKKPAPNVLKTYSRWTTDLINKNGDWILRWDEKKLRLFYIEHLLFHEVGHHIDWYYRYWSKANLKAVEEFADQYAMQRRQTATYVLNRLEKSR